MSDDLQRARTEAAIDEAFGRKPRHGKADLRAIAEAEDAAEINRLVAEIAALAVTRLGKSESDAAQHANWALIEARNASHISDPRDRQKWTVRGLQDAIAKLRSVVTFADESARKPVIEQASATPEQAQAAIDEAFGRTREADEKPLTEVTEAQLASIFGRAPRV